MDFRIGRRTEVRGNDRCGSGRAGARRERGQAILEFAFLLPVLMVVLLGMIVFGIALNNYLELTNGTTAGAQAVAVSRGQTTDPCQTAATPLRVRQRTPATTSSRLTVSGMVRVAISRHAAIARSTKTRASNGADGPHDMYQL